MTNRTTSPAKNGRKRVSSMLFYADSSDPDMRYFSRFDAVDPYLAFTVGRKKFGVAAPQEYGRMVKESAFDEVLYLPDLEKETTRRFKLPPGTQPGESQVARHLTKVYQIDEFVVGPRFPAALLIALQKAGIRVSLAEDGGLSAERQRKSAAEIEALRRANRASAAGFRLVARTLSESKVRRGILHHRGSVLTSERLRKMIRHACLDEGALALNTIAAVGDQVCDNHNVGHGPIKSGELIVVDIFPQRIEDGYWGDMTRTYLKGTASDAQRRLVRTVKRAHEMAIGMIKPGVRGGKVHAAVEDFFAREGYETNESTSDLRGFFHALGHGVGLEIHEDPIMRAGSDFRFRKGMAMTVEPGLYYPGLGGVRIEDVVHVVPGGNEKISSSPYKWEIA